MRKVIFKKGEPINEKRISLIEKVVTRLSIRAQKVTTTIIPSQLLSVHSKDDSETGVSGVVYKQLLFKGTLDKGLVVFNKKPKAPICIEFKCLGDNSGVTKTLYIDKIKDRIDLDINTEDGTILNINVRPTDKEKIINELYLSMLWTPFITSTTINQCLIDNLEKEAIKNEGI